MTNKKFSIIGRIINHETKQSLPGLGVEAWDKDLLFDDLVGKAVTDKNGTFRIEFTEDKYKEWFLDRHPDLFFKIYKDDVCIQTTENSVLWNVKTQKTKILLEIDIPAEEEPSAPSFSVSGAVRLASGLLLSESILVRAYDQGLRRRVVLGEAKTAADGSYHIPYSRKQLLDPKRGNANLLVEVLGKGDEVLASAERFPARAQETISLKTEMSADGSQWERINAQLLPALEGTPPIEITENDFPFLEKTTQLKKEQLQRRVQAARTAKASLLPDWFHYGLLQQGLPQELDALLDIPVSKVRKAFAAAIKAVDVTIPCEEECTQIWQQFESLQVDHALAKPLPGFGLKLGTVLAAAELKDQEQRAMALVLTGRKLNDPTLWDTLTEETELDPMLLKRAKLAMGATILADEHLGVATALLQDGRIADIRDLARHYGPDEWEKLVEKASGKDGSDLPEEGKDDTPIERSRKFANRIYDRVSEAHPHISVIYGLPRHPKLAENLAARMLPGIFEADPKFNLSTVRIDAYVGGNKDQLGIQSDEAKEKALLDGLKRIQRVYRLRAEPRAVARLLEDGMDSSSAIMSMGRSSFIKKYGKDFGQDEVKEIYRRAETTAARTMAVAVRFSPTINTSPLPVSIRKCPAELKGVPDYPTLFGSLDGCECIPCESVYGPAAYLTDLLAFIESEVAPVTEEDIFPANGLEAMRTRFFCDRANRLKKQPRRPDVPGTKLSCRNADTLVPYVDLVLEILENAVVPRDIGTPQTTLTTEELEAQPEHVIPAVYNKLAKTIFPLSLPFDLWHEEASIYLDKLGTSRTELLETFFPFTADNDPHDCTDIRRLNDTRIAAARLGLTDTEWKLIAKRPFIPARAASESWGYSINDGNEWWHPLRVVDTFLSRSGLEYQDLLVLLHLESCNPDSHLQLNFEDPNDCNPKKIHIEKLDTGALSWLHRFLRLQRAADFTMVELDRVLRSLAVDLPHYRPVIDEAFLIRLSNFMTLRQRFGLPLSELLSWWAPLDTVEINITNQPPIRSYYATLFLDGRPGEPQFDAFQLSHAGEGLPVLDDTIAVSTLSCVLRISSADLLALLADTITDPNPKLTLTNISLLFRHASLARALHLSINDYLVLKQLIGFDPFTAVSGIVDTAQTLRFLERVDAVRTSDFSIDELDYILRQTAPYENEQTIAPTEEWISAGLNALQEALEPLSSLETPTDPEILAQGLAQACATLLELDSAFTEVMLKKVKSTTEPTLSAEETFIKASLSGETIALSADSGLLLRRLHKAALLITKLKISPTDLKWLTERSAGNGWLDLSVLPVEGEIVKPEFDGWMRLVRLFEFCNALLPEKRENLPSLFDIDEIADASVSQKRQDYTSCLAKLSGWNKDDIGALVGDYDFGAVSHGGGGILKANFPAQFADERLPWRIMQAVRLLRRLKSTAFAASWVDGPPTFSQVQDIKQALKARYGEDWNDVLKGLRDPLREKQRQALVAYLLHEWNLNVPADLFDHFLIDVEMSPCMMTSRLIQATAAVQLFVQRVVMNLEPGMALSEEGAAQWEWMKNYRVWEANRKIFLYPENGIEPELRDDKTPFFKDLENELLQGDITNDTAETALMHYLEKLHEVANLQICGQCNSVGAGNSLELHVFGRTPDKPHHYYYRRGALEIDANTSKNAEHNAYFANFTVSSESLSNTINANWTPWERINVDIEGDHLIPIIYNRRIYLFWPIFTEKDDPAFSQLGQQLTEVFYFVCKLQVLFAELQGAISTLVLSTVPAVVAGTAGVVEDGLNEIIHGLKNTLLTGFAVFNDVTQNTSTKISRADDLGVLGSVPGLKELYGLIADLIDSVTNSGKVVFKNATNFKEIPDVELTPNLSSPNLGAQTLQISNLIVDITEQFNQFATGGFLNLVPAKRLEIQMAWSSYKNDNWSAKKTSSGIVSFRDLITPLLELTPSFPGTGKVSVQRFITFRSEVDSANNLTIQSKISLPKCDSFDGVIEPVLPQSVPVFSENIGSFHLNSSKGRLEAIDLPKNSNDWDLISSIARCMLDKLQEHNSLSQTMVTGEPISPVNGPDSSSDEQNTLVWSDFRRGYLPGHYVQFRSQMTDDIDWREDVCRLHVVDHRESNHIQTYGCFYRDTMRTYFCIPWSLPENNPGKPKDSAGVVFFPFYHPFSDALLSNLERFGIPGLYDLRFGKLTGKSIQLAADGQPLQVALRNDFYFAPPEYDPIGHVYNPPDGPRPLRPIEEIDFSTIGAYSQYNWEIFFHIPFLIASRLSTDQKFQEAQHWFHYIFNPTDASRGSVPEKYWRTKPFVEASAEDYEQQQIEELLQLLNAEAETPGLQELEWAVHQWRNDAFNPHLVARARTAAFQKAVVMKYIDNLIAWGDKLFRQENRESVYEAIQLYILAGKLLGPRPRRIPRGCQRQEYTYDELVEKRPMDVFSNALVDIESYLPPPSNGVNRGSLPFETSGSGRLDSATLAPVGDGWRVLVRSRSLLDIILGDRPAAGQKQTAGALYFCVPSNTELLEKWDTVADRLFKIRHCQNIDGQKLELPLLAPPIDPAILVRARAAGVDINDVLGQIYAPLPPYRFQIMAQKATELCNDVRSLGSALLSAMEKRDGEELALLRNTHEMRLLQAVHNIKEQQIEEATHGLAGLRKSQESTILRLAHYQKLLLTFMNPEESAATALNAGSLILQAAQFGTNWGAASASLTPDLKAGFVTTLGATFGGKNLGMAAGNVANAIGTLASVLSSAGGLVSTMGGYRRRAEDWLLQIQTVGKELEGLAEQIASAEIRLAIAESDLENHKLQIKNSNELNDFMQQKFTSKELYDWMVGQTSTLYFQSYQMAYDLARKAQRAFAFELGVDSPGIIQSVHWDNLKNGLLAGDHLHQDLKRLEIAYMEKNIREYELTKHISLLSVDPVQLITLRESGKATFSLPEALFDLDFPGHYFRRIKSVSITIPCVTGPYSGVSATLALTKSRIRCKADFTGGYNPGPDQDPLFIVNRACTRAVATSSGQNDSGLFELNFRDERYLPFEGEGVESEWELTMNKDFAQFDFDTISDVIMHVKYTARDGGDDEFRDKVRTELNNINDAFTTIEGVTQPLTRLFSVRHEFPTEWAKFRTQAAALDGGFALTLDLRTEHYPFWSHGFLNSVTDVSLWACSCADSLLGNIQVANNVDANGTSGPTPIDSLTQETPPDSQPVFGDLFHGTLENSALPEKPNKELKLRFNTNVMSDLWIAVSWEK